MSKKRGLGRGLGDLGLNELLNDLNASSTAVAAAPMDMPTATTSEGDKKEGRLAQLSLTSIHPGKYQPRKHIDEEALQELAQSIRAQGIIQPIVVRIQEGGRYELIAGERRWRAAQLAGLDVIPAIVRDIPDSAAIAMSLIENIQRRDLNIIEEAEALQRLIDEFNLGHQEIAEAVGKSRSAVSNCLRILKLNPDVRTLVEKGQLDMGHARALLSLEGALQSEVAKNVIARALSVRETEEMIRRVRVDAGKPIANRHTLEPRFLDIQDTLKEKLSAKVVIRHNSKGRGRVVIQYKNFDELDRLLEHIQ